jgi:hypothetical protein
MDTVESPMPRDLHGEDGLTCTFVIMGEPTLYARPRDTTHPPPGINAQI